MRGLVDEMKSYYAKEMRAGSGMGKTISECANTFTYRLDSMSLDVVGVTLSEVCVTRLLDLVSTGIPIKRMDVNLNRRCRGGNYFVTREALAMLLTGLLVAPLRPLQQRVHSIEHLSVTCDDDTPWHCDALSATLAAARLRWGQSGSRADSGPGTTRPSVKANWTCSQERYCTRGGTLPLRVEKIWKSQRNDEKYTTPRKQCHPMLV